MVVPGVRKRLAVCVRVRESARERGMSVTQNKDSHLGAIFQLWQSMRSSRCLIGVKGTI